MLQLYEGMCSWPITDIDQYKERAESVEFSLVVVECRLCDTRPSVAEKHGFP